MNEELRLQRVQLREELDRSRQTRRAGEKHGAARALEQRKHVLGAQRRLRLATDVTKGQNKMG